MIGALTAAVMLSGTQLSPNRVMTVAELDTRHEVLAGKVATVRGWLVECHTEGCVLGSRPTWSTSHLVSLGSSSTFDRAVRHLRDHEIIVAGIVDPTCFDHPVGDPRHNHQMICVDRVGQLRRPRLIRVLPASAEKGKSD